MKRSGATRASKTTTDLLRQTIVITGGSRVARALTSEDGLAEIEDPKEEDTATGRTEEAKEAATVVTGIGETSAVIGTNLRKLWFNLSR